MATPRGRNTHQGRVLAYPSDGRVIREAQIHDPAENLVKAWEQTGQALRDAMNFYRGLKR